MVESGGVLSKTGTFQIAIVAAACKKPFYIAAESTKFARKFPLSQLDLPAAEARASGTARGRRWGGPAEPLPPSPLGAPGARSLCRQRAAAAHAARRDAVARLHPAVVHHDALHRPRRAHPLRRLGRADQALYVTGGSRAQAAAPHRSASACVGQTETKVSHNIDFCRTHEKERKKTERPKKERKKTDNPREGWENGTPPPHRDFNREPKKERKQTSQGRDGREQRAQGILSTGLFFFCAFSLASPDDRPVMLGWALLSVGSGMSLDLKPAAAPAARSAARASFLLV